MAWKVKIAASARQDIIEIKQWYQKQSDQALKNFISELSTAIELLKENSTDYRVVYKNNRKLPLKQFPYFVFYRRDESEELIIINAVFHKHKESSAFNHRLDDEE